MKMQYSTDWQQYLTQDVVDEMVRQKTLMLVCVWEWWLWEMAHCFFLQNAIAAFYKPRQSCPTFKGIWRGDSLFINKFRVSLTAFKFYTRPVWYSFEELKLHFMYQWQCDINFTTVCKNGCMCSFFFFFCRNLCPRYSPSFPRRTLTSPSWPTSINYCSPTLKPICNPANHDLSPLSSPSPPKQPSYSVASSEKYIFL